MRKNSKIKIIFLVFGIFFSLSIIATSQVKTDVIKSERSVVKAAGEGEQINVTLHQSYLNTTTIEFVNLSHSNTFTAPCPTNPTFNSSSIEIEINDIYAPNKSLIIQDGSGDGWHDFTPTKPAVASFHIVGDGTLKNFSVYVMELMQKVGRIKAVLYNATYDPISKLYKPPSTRNDYVAVLGEFNVSAWDANWYNITGLNIPLDNSKTEGNRWFIGLFDNNTYGGDCEWRLQWDTGGGRYDNSISLSYEGIMFWDNITDGIRSVDLFLKVGLNPKDNFPLPSEIELKINNTEVNNSEKGSGYWSTKNQGFSDSDGELNFVITASWWDVSCNVTNIQINYTKTDLKANSTYTVPETKLFIWNVSINEDITCYDLRINDYNSIIFRIPAGWSDIKAYNGSIEKPLDASAPAIESYRDVIVLEAGNGTDWFLTAREDIRPPLIIDDDDDKTGFISNVTNPFLFITFLAVSGFLGLGLIVIRIWQKFKRKT
ncbi:MAG: hypothetical protein ACFFAT_20020 [Promethearchaeota archaeon]